jgi:putative addiction module antidote
MFAHGFAGLDPWGAVGYPGRVSPKAQQIIVRGAGRSLKATLPADLLKRLRVKAGDRLHVRETPDGVLLTAVDPEAEEQLAIGVRVMRRHRRALRELAK